MSATRHGARPHAQTVVDSLSSGGHGPYAHQSGRHSVGGGVESLLLLEDAFDLCHTLYSGYLGSPVKQPQIGRLQGGVGQFNAE